MRIIQTNPIMHHQNENTDERLIFLFSLKVDSNGNVKADTLRDGMKETLGKVQWLTPILDKVIPKCVEEANKAAQERKANDPESCNPSAIKMVHCMFREVQLNCPADQIKDEKSCNRLRERLQKNDLLGHHSQPSPTDNN